MTAVASSISLRYPIAVEPGDAHRAFGVVVPDLPGCFSAGDTLDDALANTPIAIAAWLSAARDANQPLPPPSTIDHLRAQHPEWAAWLWTVA